MKQTIFTLLLFTTIGMISCRKVGTEPDIKQYDEEQIKSYISTNGITGMARDTSGMYYKILKAGTGSVMQYLDSVSFVYTIHSFDGKYISADTLVNHYGGNLGHIATNGFPLGLQTAIYSLLKNRGGSMRLIIPSHLAYGVNGIGSGSNSVINSRISGNQCLDYYINVINDKPADNQDTYDDLVIQNYIKAKGFTTYTKVAPGMYYSVTTKGTGTVPITDNTTITAYYTSALLSGTIYGESNTTLATIDIPDFIKGMRLGVKAYGSAGANLSFLLSSSYAYGKFGNSSIPAYSCIKYDIRIIDVSQ
jgi:FKBP-type peptidyl-prolyl cis-trans isomerase FkpA